MTITGWETPWNSHIYSRWQLSCCRSNVTIRYYHEISGGNNVDDNKIALFESQPTHGMYVFYHNSSVQHCLRWMKTFLLSFFFSHFFENHYLYTISATQNIGKENRCGLLFDHLFIQDRLFETHYITTTPKFSVYDFQLYSQLHSFSSRTPSICTALVEYTKQINNILFDCK